MQILKERDEALRRNLIEFLQLFLAASQSTIEFQLDSKTKNRKKDPTSGHYRRNHVCIK